MNRLVKYASNHLLFHNRSVILMKNYFCSFSD
jgi:hypothetical protein